MTTSSHSRRHPDQRLKTTIIILSIRETSIFWRFFLAQLEFEFDFVLFNEVYCQGLTIWDLLVNHLRIGTCHFRSISFSAQLSGIFWWIIFGLGPVILDQSASAFVHNMPRRGQRSLSPLGQHAPARPEIFVALTFHSWGATKNVSSCRFIT